jgi:hypothetical protein
MSHRDTTPPASFPDASAIVTESQDILLPTIPHIENQTEDNSGPAETSSVAHHVVDIQTHEAVDEHISDNTHADIDANSIPYQCDDDDVFRSHDSIGKSNPDFDKTRSVYRGTPPDPSSADASPMSSTQDIAEQAKRMLAKMSPAQKRAYYFFEEPRSLLVSSGIMILYQLTLILSIG